MRRGRAGSGESATGLAALFSILCSALQVMASLGDDML